MLKPVGLVQGHYECRSLDETLPIFTGILALQVVERQNDHAIVKHPNTGWLLVVHEGGRDAREKPHNNHYGFRVADHTEVEAAYKYIQVNKGTYGITNVTQPHESHFAYSIYFKEPGGNDLEIEYYNPKASNHGRSVAAVHWTSILTEDRFPGRGYIPQAMSHGTLECDDKTASERFYRDVLGLEIAGGGKHSVYIRHPSTPWYIVVLPVKKRSYLSPASRFTLQLASHAAVEEAHREFAATGEEIGVTRLCALEQRNGRVGFIFSDLDRNWWEVIAPQEAEWGAYLKSSASQPVA